MSAGIGLCIIKVASFFLIIGVHPFVKKFTNSYIFFIVLGIIGFGFFIGTNWIRSIIELNEHVVSNFDPALLSPDRPDPATLLAKILMLDICPISCFVIHLGCIFDRKRTFCRIIAPICLFGALLTMCGGLPDPEYNAEWTTYFIFVGFDKEKGYFIIHFMNVLTSTWVLLNTPKIKTSTFPLTLLAGAIFFAYVGLCIGVSHDAVSNLGPDDHNNLWLYQNLAGVLTYDWSLTGEFRAVLEVLGGDDNIKNLPIAVAMYVGYIVFISAIILLCYFQSLLQIGRIWHIPEKLHEGRNQIYGVYQLAPVKK